MTTLLDTTVAIFTDGSAYYKDRSGGWAWVMVDAQGNMMTDSGHQGDTTVNRMELHAPYEALVRLHELNGPCEVLVYSDSQYVVKGCNDRSRKRNANPKWWKRLDRAIELHDYVEWTHVRGHSTSFYNGLADKLAGEARKERTNANMD